MKKPTWLAFFWFALAVKFSIGFGLIALQQFFQAEYVVQDDARQHVFWMHRFIEPQLFPEDLIADYFQTICPRLLLGLFYILYLLPFSTTYCGDRWQ